VASKPVILWKSARQLGWNQLALFAVYRLGLASGYYRWRTPVDPQGEEPHHRAHREHRENNERKTGSGPDFHNGDRMICIPGAEAMVSVLGEGAAEVIREAEEVVGGQGRLFGIPYPLEAEPGLAASEWGPLDHWAAFEGKGHPLVAGQDIRLVWEAGRLGWIYPLARAYLLTGEDRYAEAFWRHSQAFLSAHPTNRGPHWASGQEVAIRLMGLVFGGQVFAGSPVSTPARLEMLAGSIARHARRIPPTLVYARAQNNNHLVTEALGLYTAGLALAGAPAAAPEAGRWRELGWRWLQHAFQRQIHPDGTYVQHSTNYHRLMLQAALWAWSISHQERREWPAQSLERLRLATSWLLDRLDTTTGQVPNLGANDSAYLFPLAAGGFSDYRPVLQACGRAFLGEDLFPPGAWDEMSLWSGLEPAGGPGEPLAPLALAAPAPEAIPKTRLDCAASQSWASLRAVHFRERPSHSDQLHVELWWRGTNLAMDAGTYTYNAGPPWDNALAAARVHNTVLIDRQEPMRRAGRFLWLDWAQARLVEHSTGPGKDEERLTAEHRGYAGRGVIHERTLARCGRGIWQVTDRLKPAGPLEADMHEAELTWLLPDWPWDLDSICLRIESPYGWVRVDVQGGTGPLPGGGEPLPLTCRLVRGGVTLAGEGPPDPIRGWVSPIYGQKQPALAWWISGKSPLPFWFTTRWTLPEVD
jgi:hypothetical protein